MKYKKSQIGWMLNGIFAAIILFLYLAAAFRWGNTPLSVTDVHILSLLLVAISSLFYKLTIEIKESSIHLSYGIGLISINLKMDELEQVEIIKTPWYYGLGIRITPKGMLYNIQGSKAVKIDYTRNGKKKTVMIGTAEPGELKKALQEVGKSGG